MGFTRGGASADDGLLVFADGSHFSGRLFGARRPVVGELVFNTSMTGYQEAVTDPSYAGQILAFAYPLQGNYGTAPADLESDRVHVSAVVCREVTGYFRHASSSHDFGDFLASFEVPGLQGVDTRAIVRAVREHGVMPASLSPFDPSDSLEEQVRSGLASIKKFSYAETDFVPRVSPKEPRTLSPKGAAKHVAFVDCGAKRSMLQELLRRNLKVTVYPFDVSAKELLRADVDGVMYSNGPGDPTRMKPTVDALKGLLGEKPVFGVCLGHQVLGLALGARTYKLKFGHRGSNHAVRNLESGRVFITSQNHGYAVDNLPAKVQALFVNCNDQTNEGLRADGLRAFSCQFHPEGSCGPKDSNALFDEFVKTL